MSAVVELDGVTRTFPGSPPVEAVKEASLVVESGDYVAIFGPSGSGKSTLLHILGCLDTPTAGSYRLLGQDVGTLNDGLRTSLRGSEVGFVFQAFHLLPYRTVVENVMLPSAASRGGFHASMRAPATELLGAMGLGALVGAFTRHQVVETLGVRSIPITITKAPSRRGCQSGPGGPPDVGMHSVSQSVDGSKGISQVPGETTGGCSARAPSSLPRLLLTGNGVISQSCGDGTNP